MGLGIKEPAKSRSRLVPGTSVLFEPSSTGTAAVKHASGKDADLILVPQPSSSPNDPLVGALTRVYDTSNPLFRIGLCGRKT